MERIRREVPGRQKSVRPREAALLIANRNQLWGTVVAEELQRCGVTDVCLSPGSRSTPLALALRAQNGLRITTHVDERSAAFFALGVAKASRRTVALLCTSGTAAANYLPAIIEANQARVPLLVLTADRPPELHDVGANQSIDQQGLYGRHVRWFVDVGLPQVTAVRVRHLRALVCRAVARTGATPPGPVHLNFPFQEPLEPTPVPDDVPTDWHRGDLEAATGRGSKPFLRIDVAQPTPAASAIAAVAKLVEQSPDGVIVVGPRFPDPAFADAIKVLAEATGYPILADPLSGVRFAGVPCCVAYDAWLADPKRRTHTLPRLVLRLGATPTSKNLLQWLKENANATHVLFDESGGFGEETTRATHVVGGDPGAAALAVAQRCAKRTLTPFGAKLTALDDAARQFLMKEAPKRAFEGALMLRLIASLPKDSTLFVSNSLPVRDLDRFGGADIRLSVHANRGASGIDGITSTALGVAHATGKKVVLVTGDLAFLHDLGGLVAQKRLALPLDIVVFDNDGGGIFEFLPIARHGPPFAELFLTPHGLDLGKIGAALGFDTQVLDADAALSASLRLGARSTKPRLVVVRTDAKANVAHRRDLEAALGTILDKAAEATTRAR